MNKQSYMSVLFLASTLSCVAMDSQESDASMKIKVPRYNMRKSRVRKQAEKYLLQAMVFEALGHQKGSIDITKMVQTLESYFAAQKAHKDGDEKTYERCLLEAAACNYPPSYLGLASLYLKRAQEYFKLAQERGDQHAATMLEGLKKYSLIQLLTGKIEEEEEPAPTDNPLYSSMYI